MKMHVFVKVERHRARNASIQAFGAIIFFAQNVKFARGPQMLLYKLQVHLVLSVFCVFAFRASIQAPKGCPK